MLKKPGSSFYPALLLGLASVILLLSARVIVAGALAADSNASANLQILTSTPQPDGSIEHVIAPGETLWTVAAIYGVDLNELLALNGFTDTPLLQQGEVILVRPPHTATPTEAPPPTGTASPIPPTITPTSTASPTLPPPTATPRVKIDLSQQRPTSMILIALGAVLLTLGVILGLRSRRSSD